MIEAAADASRRAIGRYVLYGAIASGGMATVHYGRLVGAAGFSRVVAIKRLHEAYARSSEFVAMMIDEARLMSRIRHPNVTAVLDAVSDDGELWIVMDYLHGVSLAELQRIVIGRNECVPASIASRIMLDTLAGLHAAHEATDEHGRPLEIVHRDISPHNIIVATDGAAHVVDFGVAKAAGRVQTTRDGEVKGKLAYMPPEQVSAEPIDRRADVYAAGVVLWELLAGDRLFRSKGPLGLMHEVVYGDLAPPSSKMPALSSEIDRVTLCALSRGASERFETALAFAVALERACPPASAREVKAWLEEVASALNV